MSVQLRKFQNSISLHRKRVPEKEILVAELASTQAEFKASEQELRRLEKHVEDSSNPSRLRFLSGDNPTRDELCTKLDKVEVLWDLCIRELFDDNMFLS